MKFTNLLLVASLSLSAWVSQSFAECPVATTANFYEPVNGENEHQVLVPHTITWEKSFDSWETRKFIFGHERKLFPSGHPSKWSAESWNNLLDFENESLKQSIIELSNEGQGVGQVKVYYMADKATRVQMDREIISALRCYAKQFTSRGVTNDVIAPSPTQLASKPDQPQPETQPDPHELTDQQREQQLNEIADATSDDVLKGMSASQGSKSAAKPVLPAAKPKTYRDASKCLQLFDVGHGMFQNQFRNNCDFKVAYSFCTVSDKGTGAFSCKANQYGSDIVGPHKVSGGMRIGVPDAKDPFHEEYGACEYPGLAVDLSFDGTHLKFNCR